MTKSGFPQMRPLITAIALSAVASCASPDDSGATMNNAKADELCVASSSSSPQLDDEFARALNAIAAARS